MCMGIISMFLLTGTLVVSAGKLTTGTIGCLDNSPPEMTEAQAIWKISWNKNGMNAPFSAKADDPDNDNCRLCVTISDSSNGARTGRSGYSEDYKKKYVSISLDPDDYPIGLHVDYDMWVEDIHGAESSHWTGGFDIKKSNAKSLSIRSVLLEKIPIIQLLLQFKLMNNLLKL